MTEKNRQAEKHQSSYDLRSVFCYFLMRAAAFAAILTAVTTVSLLLYLKISKSEDVRL